MVPAARERTQQRTLKDTGRKSREPETMESRRKDLDFFLGEGININKCKQKVKMTQTQMCLLY